MRWTRGEQAIQDLLQAGELMRAPALARTVTDLLDTARAHAESAAVIACLDPAGAYQLYCGAAHKSAEALLCAQGLRPTAKGGCLAVKDAVVAQFGRTQIGDVFAHLGRMHRRDRQLDHTPDNAPDPEELQSARRWTLQILEIAARLSPRLDPF